MSIFFFFLLSFWHGLFLYSSEIPLQPLELNVDDRHGQLLCSTWLDRSIDIQAIEIRLDNAGDLSELHSLLNTYNRKSIDAHYLKDIYFLLAKKNAFRKIIFSFARDKNTVFRIHLESYWKLKKVYFESPLLGKDRFKHFYTIEQGEVFDITKHHACINSLKKAFHDEGFFSAYIHDVFFYIQKEKSIIVKIVLDPGYQYIIKELSINLTCKTLSEEEIAALKKRLEQKFASVLVGEYYTKELIETQIKHIKKNLYKKGFLDVNHAIKLAIDEQKSSIAIQLDIGLKDQRLYTFIGNSFFSKKELFEYATFHTFHMHHFPIEFLKQELSDLYASKGFWQAEIKHEMVGQECTFVINEGKRFTCEQLVIHGAYFFKQDELIKECFSKTKKYPFDDALFKEDIKRLTDRYVQEGFLGVIVEGYTYKKDQKGDFCVELTIQEGSRKIIQAFKFLTPNAKLQGQLEIGIKTPLGTICTPELLADKKNDIARFLKKMGHAHFYVDYELQFQDEQCTVLWHIDVNDLQSATFGKTVLQGTTCIPYDCIKSYLPYTEGTPFSQKTIDTAIASLKELHVFESVSLYPDNQITPDGKRLLMLRVVDDDPFEVRLRAGFQQVSKNLTFRQGTTYKFGWSLWCKNPFKHADFFKFDADLTRFYRYVCGAYCYPGIANIPLSLMIKGYSNKYTQPIVVGSDKTLYNITQQGGLLGFNYSLGRSFLGFNVGVEFM